MKHLHANMMSLPPIRVCCWDQNEDDLNKYLSLMQDIEGAKQLYDTELDLPLGDLAYQTMMQSAEGGHLEMDLDTNSLLISIGENSLMRSIEIDADDELGVIALQGDTLESDAEQITIQIGGRYIENTPHSLATLALSDKQVHLYDYHMDTMFEEFPEHVHLSLNLNFFSPSEVPDIKNPVPGGPLWWPALVFIRDLFKCRKVHWIDIHGMIFPCQAQTHAFISNLVNKLMVFWHLNQDFDQIGDDPGRNFSHN